MRGVYTVHASIASVTTAVTLIQIKAGSANSLEILRAWCGNATTTTDDRAEFQLLRKTAAATVTSFTPIEHNQSGPAAAAVGGTTSTGHTATDEGTDGDIIIRESTTVLAPWVWHPTPLEQIIVPASGIIALKLAIAITAADLVCGVTFVEND